MLQSTHEPESGGRARVLTMEDVLVAMRTKAQRVHAAITRVHAEAARAQSDLDGHLAALRADIDAEEVALRAAILQAEASSVQTLEQEACVVDDNLRHFESPTFATGGIPIHFWMLTTPLAPMPPLKFVPRVFEGRLVGSTHNVQAVFNIGLLSKARISDFTQSRLDGGTVEVFGSLRWGDMADVSLDDRILLLEWIQETPFVFLCGFITETDKGRCHSNIRHEVRCVHVDNEIRFSARIPREEAPPAFPLFLLTSYLGKRTRRCVVSSTDVVSTEEQ
jgi:hypothetical protein